MSPLLLASTADYSVLTTDCVSMLNSTDSYPNGPPPSTYELNAWSPTHTPSFHEPARFGAAVLEGAYTRQCVAKAGDGPVL